MIRTLSLGAALIGVAFLGVGCSSGNARYRFVQASTSVPATVDLQFDGKSIQTSIAFGQGTGYHGTSSGSHKVELFATGTTKNPYVDAGISIPSGDDSTMFSSGPFASIGLTVFTDDNTAPTAGNAKLRILNVAPTVGPIDVYVVPAGSGIAGGNPQVPNLAYATASLYLSEAAGSYDVVVTVNGTQNVIASLTGTYTLTSGQIRSVVILDSPVGGGPFSLVELSDVN
jgi:hypothetical protein